jgi:streptogramin lyase
MHMRLLHKMLALGASLVALSFAAGALAQQAPLSGQVSAPGEPAMEGVVISAKKEGSIVTLSVISDEKGRFAFPAGRLEPGKYALSIRATGYELDGAKTLEIGSSGATQDIKLKKTRNIAGQLTNSEWMQSVPGPDDMRAALLDCQTCHTLERVFRSTYDSDTFTQVLTRMANYASESFWLKPQARPLNRASNPEQFRKMADYIASFNLSTQDTWSFPLKTLPRISGRGTKVIITEYDLPRRTIQPHDVVIDKEGVAWYSDFGDQMIGKFDPKTLQHTEIRIPLAVPGRPTGSLDLELERDGKFLVGMMNQGAIGQYDPKADKWKIWEMPPEFNKENIQLNQVTINHHVDGKVWTNTNDGTGNVYRLDVNTGKYELFQPLKLLPGGPAANAIYQVSPDSQNNGWLAEFRNNYIGRIDAKTGETKFYPVPTEKSRNRRGRMDEQDRFWFAQYRGNKVAVFDTRTLEIKEWPMASPWSAPYDLVTDKNGDIWSAGMASDRVTRVNQKTGETVEYQLPRPTNVRRVVVDDAGPRPVFWTGSNHGASIVKLEPLD